jgi:phage baseplate assembly protein W
MATTSNLTFRDVNITFKKHPVTDDVLVSKDASAIKQAIVNLLLTNKGEKLFNPEYGSDIRKYLFEPLDYATAGLIANNIRYTIRQFEPRISVLSLEAIPNFDDNGFDIEMTYEIRGTNQPPTTVEFFLSRTR